MTVSSLLNVPEEVLKSARAKSPRELDSILISLCVISLCKFSVILSNIVAYCVVLSKIGLFPARQSTEEKSLSDSSLISSSTSST